MTTALSPAALSPALAELIELLDLERIELNLFRAYHPKGRRGRLFGGQIMAQALRAAAHTTDAGHLPHSLHGYFLRPGDPTLPALIDVERIRDGRSFCTRRVVVIQDGQAIFNLDASFQIPESGLEHQLDMPSRPPPPSEDKLTAAMRHGPFLDWRVEHKQLMADGGPQEPSQHIWFRANGPVADDALLHVCLMVYESDRALLSTSRLPHRGNFERARLQMASLDHAMWFHHPPLEIWRVDEWLLYAMDSPSSASARGYNRGMIFNTAGKLIASTMQEGLIRKR